MSTRDREFKYDVCLSFAGEDRPYVKDVAEGLRSRGIRVFYDDYERSELWGKNLYTHLDEIYRRAARYCILFISQHYAKKLWTNHERESSQARAFTENEEYLLPARFDDSEIPGVRPTTSYIDLRTTTPAELSALIAEKLGMIATTAVFIDGDWLKVFARGTANKIDFKALMRGLRANFGADAQVWLQLSDFGGQGQKNRRIAALKAQGYSLEVVNVGQHPVYASKGFDVRLALRAAELPPNVRTLVLITGDSDFIPLLERARAVGRTTVLITSGVYIASGLRESADRIMALRELLPGWSDVDRKNIKA